MAYTPKHAQVRFDSIKEDVDELAAFAKANQEVSAWALGGLVHDIRSNARMLATFAEYWQDFCRKTGQNPFKVVNEDGSINK